MAHSKKFFIWVISICLSFTLGCVHTKPSNTKYLKIEGIEKVSPVVEIDSNLRLEHIIYNSSKLPLTDFFTRLTAGEFKDALTEIDIRYIPANSDNEILNELIKDGLVPAFVKVTNVSSAPIKLNEIHFYLQNGPIKYQAIHISEIPRTFKRFHPAAFAANVFNVTVVVMGYIIVALALSPLCSHNCLMGSGSGPSASRSGDAETLNSIDKTTNIVYRDYLIQEMELSPGESIQGMLFFYNENKGDMRKFRLKHNPNLKINHFL